MASDRTHARKRLNAVVGIPGWTVVAGIVIVALVAAPAWLRPQDAEEDEAVAEAAPPVRPGDPGTYPGWGEANFPHDFHIDDLEIPCEDCHHETNAARLVMPHDDYFEDFWIDCTICHKTDGDVSLDPQDCGECHHSNPGDTADETLSAKVVIHMSCWECHDSGTGAEAASNCSFCHDGPARPE